MHLYLKAFNDYIVYYFYLFVFLTSPSKYKDIFNFFRFSHRGLNQGTQSGFKAIPCYYLHAFLYVCYAHT